MNWETLTTVGGHTVYSGSATRCATKADGIVVHDRRWCPPTGVRRVDEPVELYVPIGALSGEHTHVVVRMSNDAVELWPRSSGRVKGEGADGS